jgi:hypothetical protein
MDAQTAQHTEVDAAGSTGGHWHPPDIPGDILAAAFGPGLPAPASIHVRPELAARMDGVSAVPRPRTEHAGSVPVVVDDQIPMFPGYEIHRRA